MNFSINSYFNQKNPQPALNLLQQRQMTHCWHYQIWEEILGTLHKIAAWNLIIVAASIKWVQYLWSDCGTPCVVLIATLFQNFGRDSDFCLINIGNITVSFCFHINRSTEYCVNRNLLYLNKRCLSIFCGYFLWKQLYTASHAIMFVWHCHA